MIKNIFYILLFFSLPVIANKLQPIYYFDSKLVTSKTIDHDCGQEFVILRIPDDKTSYRVDSMVIAKTFELHGLSVDISNIRYVNFLKQSPVDFEPFKEQLSNILRTHYGSIEISNVSITPRGYIDSLPGDAKAVFDPRAYLNAKGTFYVQDSEGVRRYMDYSVEATVKILHTVQRVSRKETLNSANCEIKTIPLTSFKDIPITHLPADTYRFRTSLKPDTLLTVRNIEEIPLVKKNDKVTVSVSNGLVVVEFGAIAMQEGSLYDIITIQKRDGKRAKAKVIGENRVELQ